MSIFDDNLFEVAYQDAFTNTTEEGSFVLHREKATSWLNGKRQHEICKSRRTKRNKVSS